MSAADDAMIPENEVFALLRDLARERGLRVKGGSTSTDVLCLVCHPDQPEWLLGPDGVEREWWRVTGWRHRAGDDLPCEGHVIFRLPGPWRHPRELVCAAEVASLIEVTVCCHDDDDALGGWDWRDDLTEALAGAVAANDGSWADQAARDAAAREASLAREAARTEVRSAAAGLGHRLLVQAVAGVLKDAGQRDVQVRGPGVSWECDHPGWDDEWGLVALVVAVNGLLTMNPDSTCSRHEDEVPLDVLAAKYREVAAMTPEEQAKYQPAPERAKGGRGMGRRPKAPRQRVTDAQIKEAMLVAVAEAGEIGGTGLRQAVVAALGGVDVARINPCRAALVREGLLVQSGHVRRPVFSLGEPLPEE